MLLVGPHVMATRFFAFYTLSPNFTHSCCHMHEFNMHICVGLCDAQKLKAKLDLEESGDQPKRAEVLLEDTRDARNARLKWYTIHRIC